MRRRGVGVGAVKRKEKNKEVSCSCVSFWNCLCIIGFIPKQRLFMESLVPVLVSDLSHCPKHHSCSSALIFDGSCRENSRDEKLKKCTETCLGFENRKYRQRRYLRTGLATAYTYYSADKGLTGESKYNTCPSGLVGNLLHLLVVKKKAERT